MLTLSRISKSVCVCVCVCVGGGGGGGQCHTFYNTVMHLRIRTSNDHYISWSQLLTYFKMQQKVVAGCIKCTENLIHKYGFIER